MTSEIRQTLRRLPQWVGVAACVLASLASNAFAQETGLLLEDVKVHYIIEAVKHIKWPNDNNMSRIQVAILSRDGDIQAAFRNREPVQIRGKPLEFNYLEDAGFDPDAYDLIFIGRRFKSQHKVFFERTKSTLIVVDGRVEQERQMLSLVTLVGQVSLHLNRDNLVQRGFQPSINLLEFAGTKEDLSDQLRENQVRLDDLVNEVASKESRVEELNGEMILNAANLEVARNALAAKAQEFEESRLLLHSLAGQIEDAQTEVLGYRVEIDKQQELFTRTRLEFQGKQQEIHDGEQAIEALKLEIGKNQEVLDRQLSRIEQQRAMLAQKSETIDVLRDRLFAILGVILAFFVLVYFLLRLNTLRKKANRDLETLNAQLYEFATIDSMTGLSNRRHFLELAQKELLHHRRGDSKLTVLMMDVDHFKQVNDNYGHAAGDKVIEAVGQLLTKNLREYDLVGRLGGEEYAMLLVDCDERQSLEIADRICADVSGAEITFQDLHIQVTISIGIGKIRQEDREIAQPLARADKALLKAKADGRNRVIA